MGTNHGGVNFGRRLPPIGGQYSTPINTYPYGGDAVNERLSMWGIVGYGVGELALTPEGSSRLEADIDLAMAAAGAQGYRSRRW